MPYIPGHSTFVAWAASVGSITESANGTTPAALPSLPIAVPTLISYTDVPGAAVDFGNSLGYGGGSAYALYKKPGIVKPSVEFEVKFPNILFLANCFFDVNEALPDIELYVGVEGQYTDVYRYCKCGQVTLNYSEGEANELRADVRFEAVAVQAGSPTAYSFAQAAAAGSPFFWHDVRAFNITNSAGVVFDYRRSLMGLNATINYNIERKGERVNWGDNEPLSRTNYELMPHQAMVNGEISLHDRLPLALFTGAVAAQNWGGISIPITDGVKIANTTIVNPYPTGRFQNRGDVAAQLGHRVPFNASNITMSSV